MSEEIAKPFKDTSTIIEYIGRIERFVKRVEQGVSVTVSDKAIAMNICGEYFSFKTLASFKAFVDGYEVAVVMRVRHTKEQEGKSHE